MDATYAKTTIDREGNFRVKPVRAKKAWARKLAAESGRPTTKGRKRRGVRH